jgi:hypothetical protein
MMAFHEMNCLSHNDSGRFWEETRNRQEEMQQGPSQDGEQVTKQPEECQSAKMAEVYRQTAWWAMKDC